MGNGIARKVKTANVDGKTHEGEAASGGVTGRAADYHAYVPKISSLE